MPRGSYVFVVLLSCMMLASSTLFSQVTCLNNGITINNQFQLVQFKTLYPDCEVIGGDVTIKGSGITDLSNLSCIQKIEGTLKIDNTSIDDFTGLDALTEITGDLTLLSNEDLENLDGLDALEKIGNQLGIYLCMDLEHVDGLSNLDTIGGNINFDFLVSLVDITGLNNLQYTKSIDFIDLTADIDFGTFAEITALDYLRVWDIPDMSAIDFFPNLAVVNDLNILNNDILTDISIIDQLNIDSLERLAINQNPLLNNCELDLFCDILALPFEKNIEFNGTDCDFEVLMESCCTGGYHDNVINTWLIESPTPWQCDFEERWECPSFWSLSSPPTDCHHAIIPHTSTVIVSVGIDNRCQSLTIESNVDFTMEPNATLETGP